MDTKHSILNTVNRLIAQNGDMPNPTTQFIDAFKVAYAAFAANPGVNFAHAFNVPYVVDLYDAITLEIDDFLTGKGWFEGEYKHFIANTNHLGHGFLTYVFITRNIRFKKGGLIDSPVCGKPVRN